MAKKFNKKYSSKEKAAYWAGVGIAAANFKESAVLLENKDAKIQKSAWAGYEAVNRRDAANKVFTGKHADYYSENVILKKK